MSCNWKHPNCLLESLLHSIITCIQPNQDISLCWLLLWRDNVAFFPHFHFNLFIRFACSVAMITDIPDLSWQGKSFNTT